MKNENVRMQALHRKIGLDVVLIKFCLIIVQKPIQLLRGFALQQDAGFTLRPL